MTRRGRGMTVIELLLAVAILGILAALLTPAAVSAGERAEQADCTAHLRQISQAVTMYLQDYDGHRPSYLHQLSPGHITSVEVFQCRADDWLAKGGWGWSAWGQYSTPYVPWPFPVSYGYFWHIAPNHTRPGSEWRRAMAASENAGHTVCVLHGEPRRPMTTGEAPFFEGLVLRAGFNGEVVRRRITYPKGRGHFSSWRLRTE